MIDMNADLKNDTDEESNKFIIVTDVEEARKAMIAKRFGGNTKGAAIGGNGTQRRKSKAVHKSGEGKLKEFMMIMMMITIIFYSNIKVLFYYHILYLYIKYYNIYVYNIFFIRHIQMIYR